MARDTLGRDGQARSRAESRMTAPSAYGDAPAPLIAPGLEWLNTGRSLSMDDFRGRLTIFHFWTYA